MLIYTAHAQMTLRERALSVEWVERAVQHPDRTEPDPDNPTVRRAFKRIPEAGNRIIRVVHRPQGTDILVITAFLDRGAKL
ncbi:MAG TPA: DUF4258 domain-containing protein [Azospirillum sp.]